MTLRWKLLLPINLALLVVWLAYSAWHMVSSRQRQTAAELRLLRHVGLGLRLSLETALGQSGPLDLKPLQRHLETVGKSSPGLEIMVLDRRSVVVASTIPRRLGNEWLESDIRSVLAGEHRYLVKHTPHEHEGIPSLDVTLAVTDAQGRLRYALHLSRSLLVVRQELRRQIASALGFGVLLILVVGALINALTLRYMLRPLEALRRQLEASSWPGEARPPGCENEIGRLASTFQDMLAAVERTTGELRATVDEKSRLLADVTTLRDRLAQRVEATTEQLQAAQAALVRNERLAVLGQMAAALAHELRNPLHIIRAAAETTSRRIPETQPTAVDIIEEVDRIAHLIDRLLGYTRPLEVAPEPIDCEALLLDVERKLTPGLGGPPRADLRWEHASDLPGGRLQADPLLLLQALVNLAENAVAASPPGGCIRLSATQGPGDSVVLRVEDEGAGVAPELRDRVFEPFVSGSPTGTGLGLAIVRRIADLHGGEVSLVPRPGGGTCAILTLPLHPPTARVTRTQEPGERETHEQDPDRR